MFSGPQQGLPFTAAPNLSQQNRDDHVHLGTECDAKLLILDLDVHFIIHIKQVLTKKKSGRHLSLSKSRGEAAASDSQGMLRRAHRPKLKIHIEILSSLACFGPMKLHGLMTGLD